MSRCGELTLNDDKVSLLCNNVVVTNPSPSVTSLIAAVVAYIGYRQWRTANDKLRLDLYNRRFEVYEAAVVLGEMLPQWKASPEQLKAWNIFKRAVNEARFLFPPDSRVGEQFQAFKNNSQNIVLLDVLMNYEDQEGNKDHTNWEQFRIDAINVCINRKFILDWVVWPYLELYSIAGPFSGIKRIRSRRRFGKSLEAIAERGEAGITKIMAQVAERGGRPLE